METGGGRRRGRRGREGGGGARSLLLPRKDRLGAAMHGKWLICEKCRKLRSRSCKDTLRHPHSNTAAPVPSGCRGLLRARWRRRPPVPLAARCRRPPPPAAPPAGGRGEERVSSERVMCSCASPVASSNVPGLSGPLFLLAHNTYTRPRRTYTPLPSHLRPPCTSLAQFCSVHLGPVSSTPFPHPYTLPRTPPCPSPAPPPAPPAAAPLRCPGCL